MTIEIEPTHAAQKSVIWLHGLGADGNDFVPIVPELRLPATLRIRFIFPNAPVIPVTINNGYAMRAWYDITMLSTEERHIDKIGIQRSVSFIEQLIEKEITRGITSNNIILAGFSQGAVMALTTGLGYTKPLGGILALSGYLPFASTLTEWGHAANRHTPIFLAHGTEDQVVPYALGKAACFALEQAAYHVSWHTYAMPHSVCPAEINDISQWLQHLRP